MQLGVKYEGFIVNIKYKLLQSSPGAWHRECIQTECLKHIVIIVGKASCVFSENFVTSKIASRM